MTAQSYASKILVCACKLLLVLMSYSEALERQRPWCVGGAAMCRGDSTSTVARFGHTMTLVGTSQVSQRIKALWQQWQTCSVPWVGGPPVRSQFYIHQTQLSELRRSLRTGARRPLALAAFLIAQTLRRLAPLVGLCER